MPTRRGLLATVSSVAVVGIAGCSGSESGGSDTLDCQTDALEHGDGDVLNGGAFGDVEDGNVMIVVPLSTEKVRENNIDRIDIYDPADALAYTIPVSVDDAELMANKPDISEGQLQYEQFVGHRPFHGQFRIVAVDEDGEPTDFITIEFNCFPSVSS